MTIDDKCNSFRGSFSKDEYLQQEGYKIVDYKYFPRHLHIYFNGAINCVIKDLIQIHFYGHTTQYETYKVIIAY